MGKSADLHTVYAFFFKVANIADMKKICIANFSIRYIGLQQAPFPLAYTFREKIISKLKSKKEKDTTAIEDLKEENCISKI